MINAADIKIINHGDVEWKTPTLKSNYNQLNITQQNITFANGVSLVNSNIFADVIDAKINQETLVLLSNTKPVSQLFDEQKKNIDVKNEAYYTALFIEDYTVNTTTSSYIKKQNSLSSDTVKHSDKEYRLKYITTRDGTIKFTASSIFSNAELFKFTFESDYVLISNLDNQYITSRSIVGRKEYIHLTNKIEGSDFQKFNYILNDTSITLFKYNSNYTQVLDFNIYNNNIEYTNITNIFSIPDSAVLFIDNFRFKINSKSITDSFIAKYNINNLSATNLLVLDEDVKSLNYSQNYLINIPFYTTKDYYDVYVSSLKNYQTPSSEYTTANNNLSRRDYTNLFTGTNQKYGYENIFLNYTSDTLEKTLKKDIETYFHYPATASSIYLSAAGLIEEGAIASNNPYSSDRIYFSNRDYREIGLPSDNTSVVNNVWRCAWLSGNNAGESVWMDRSYAGAQFLEPIELHNILLKSSDPLIIDTPSTMMLVPNKIYKYFHQGINNIKTYTDSFKSVDRDDTTKILEITSWDSYSLTDRSVHHNNGVVVSSEPFTLFNDYIDLYSTNYILFPHTPSLFEDKELTLGMWYRVNDWEQARGSQIFGNFADGGLGLFNTLKEDTFDITIINTTNNYVYNYSEEFVLKSKQLLINDTKGPIYVVRTLNKNFWLIDSHRLTATNFDINNNKLNTIYFSDIRQINQVEADIAENIYVVDSVTKKVIRFDGYEGGVNKILSLPVNVNRIEVVYNYTGSIPSLFYDYQTNTTIIGVNSTTSTTDIYNNVWSAVGTSLYKNLTEMYASIYNIREITTDSDGYLWILHEDKITKLNINTNYFVFTKKLFNNSNVKNINFVNIIQDKIYTTYALCMDAEAGLLYIIDSDGNIHKTISLEPGVNNYGDYTAYHFQRKFNLKNQFMWKVYVTESSGTDYSTSGSVYTLPFNLPSIDNEWHYYTFTFSSLKGYMSVYVDGRLHSNKFFDKDAPQPNRFKIKQSSKPYTTGIFTSKRGVNNARNIGSISRLHLYKYSFDDVDIKHLYNSTYTDKYQNLIWNINVGKRNYIEQIDKFFMHKMPGNKSKYYNIKIKNFIATSEQKNLIEKAIKDIIPSIAPADTTLNLIKWES